MISWRDLSLSAEVPYSLRGTLTGSDLTPPELVVALNGTLAGTSAATDPLGTPGCSAG